MSEDIYLGELSDELLNDWSAELESPYSALKTRVKLKMPLSSCWGWDKEDPNLKSRKKLSWDGVVWKGNKEEVEAFLADQKAECSKPFPLKDGVEYGVLVIEDPFGGLYDD